MANRNERNRADGREREKDATGRKEGSLDSEAVPGADHDPDAAYDSSTSGGAAGEIEELSETPPAAQRGRDLDH